MPPKVDAVKCNGCHGESEPLCVKVCPGDLMVIDKNMTKAIVRDPGDCWDCMTCTKACPQQAIQTMLQYQLAYYPGKLIPKMKTNSIAWTSIDSRGRVERYVMKTLTSKGNDEDDD